MDSSPAQHGKPAGVFSSLAFRRLWLLGGIVNAMRWVEMLAAGLFIFRLTGSGAEVALVLAARSLPMLCFGAISGVLCDAISRKSILFWGMALSAGAAGGIVALDGLGWVRPWHLGCAAFLSGSVWATELSGRRRMIGECAGAGLVSRVVALDSLTNSLARILGPLMGSLVFAWIGLSGAYGLTALSYLAAALLVPGIPYRQTVRRLRLARIPRELAEGLGYAIRQPTVLAVLSVTATMNAFAFAYSAMVAPIARLGFGVPDALVGLLAAGEPAGALLGGLLLARRPPRSDPVLLLIGGSALFMAALVLMPLMPFYWAACLTLTGGGLGLALFSNMQTGLILTGVPAALRSRQMGLTTVCIGVGPLGQLTIGALAQSVGPLRAVVFMALAGLLVLAAIGLRTRARTAVPIGRAKRRTRAAAPVATQADRSAPHPGDRIGPEAAERLPAPVNRSSPTGIHSE